MLRSCGRPKRCGRARWSKLLGAQCLVCRHASSSETCLCNRSVWKANDDPAKQQPGCERGVVSFPQHDRDELPRLSTETLRVATVRCQPIGRLHAAPPSQKTAQTRHGTYIVHSRYVLCIDVATRFNSLQTRSSTINLACSANTPHQWTKPYIGPSY